MCKLLAGVLHTHTQAELQAGTAAALAPSRESPCPQPRCCSPAMHNPGWVGDEEKPPAPPLTALGRM